MTDRYENIRKALAMGPTPGPWEIRDGRTDTVENAQGYPVCTVHYHPHERYGHGTRAAYIAACDPDTIRELLAERDALAAENARLRAEVELWKERAYQAQTPLTDADITALLPIWQQGSWTLPDYGRWVARAVERAHGIKTSHNLCLSCGHSIDAHDKQYGCAEDGCDCETPNA